MLDSPIPGVVVVSFPKSGRTWLRVMLDHLKVHLTYTHDDSGHLKRLRFDELDADKSDYCDQRVVLLIRDPRDVVVSGFFMATHRLGLYRGDLSAFLRDERHGLQKVLAFNQAWYAARHQVADFLLVRYERMHEDLEAVQRRILRFVDRRVDDNALRDAIELGRFPNMQRLERTGYFEQQYGVLLAGGSDDPDSLKTRRGKVGGYVDYLGPEDLAYCQRLLEETGYPLMQRTGDEA
ncbi:MAG: sulfotransferase domain-containing protein [Acidobacteriota bacterium]